MSAADSITSVREPQSAVIKVKGSRFIAEAFPVSSEGRAESHIEDIRRREHGASHHCTAYRIGQDGDLVRYDDDGEPSGTAGLPILRQIDARGLTNTLVVVTRYFGGTKLGTGGLTRAYGDAAASVLDRCNSVVQVISERVNVSFNYDDTSPAMHTIEKYAVKVLDASYTEKTEMTLAIPRSEVGEFVKAFREALGGRGEVEVEG